jgi:F-type H+-transporting ATPase subunit epsilon
MNDTRTQLQLRVLLPTQELLNVPVSKVIADAMNGSFCLEPRHIDFVSALVPGVLSYWDLAGQEHFAGIDQGILVKCGQDVSVSTINGVLSESLQDLRAQMEQHFVALDEQDKKARAALARLEASTLRGFWETREQLSG